ncbi:Spermidine synthase [Mycena sanguinolenta]|uniref:Spermidine synthase n=1 Tax=Mycena sanguinolenta TaxID=230812 RepID=A0A8H6YAQ5_9AGAR|nr:Spermidine synthase [Mycena sanguinolenta]
MFPISWPAGARGVACRLAVDFAVLVALSLVLFVYERALIPLYGSGPRTIDGAVLFATLVAAAHPIPVSLTRALLFGGFIFAVAPPSTYWVAVWTARWGRAILGPLVTHSVVLVPMLSVLETFVVEINPIQNTPSPPKSRNSIGYRSLAALASFAGIIGLSPSWAKVSYLNNVSETQIFLGLAAAMFNIWIMTFQVRRTAVPQKSKSKSKKKAISSDSPTLIRPLLLALFNALWWKTHKFLASPVLPHPLLAPYLHPDFPLVIHSSVQSTTGLIVVGEALPPPSYQGGSDAVMHSLRYLRASHSLLGGVWMGGKIATLDDVPPQVDSYGTPLGDSIYGTFVLQEAARLVNSSSRAGKWERARPADLVLGFRRLLSIVMELRPRSSKSIPQCMMQARLYFGLPDHPPENLFLEDARAWAAKRRASVGTDKSVPLFDIAVHDCFSGGGVPEHIYTVEFWDDLKVALHPEGVLAVNFAGMIKSDASRMISQTLKTSFGHCRAFHDSQRGIKEEEYETELINLVFFCSRSGKSLTFREARRSDYLDSYLREHVLSGLPEREVPFELLTGQLDSRFILTDTHNPLGKLQNAQGPHHWWLMRQVLPDIFWETY